MPAETQTIAPLLLTPRDAAKVMSLSERTLWTLTQRGELPAVWIGRAKRYAVTDLAAWIDSQKAAGNGAVSVGGVR